MSVVVSTPNLRVSSNKPLSSSSAISITSSLPIAIPRSKSSFAPPVPRSPLSSYVNHSSHQSPLSRARASTPATNVTNLGRISLAAHRGNAIMPAGSPPASAALSSMLLCRSISEPVKSSSSSSSSVNVPSSPVRTTSSSSLLRPSCTPPQLRTPTRSASSASSRAECRLVSSMASPRVASAVTQSPCSVKRAYSLFTPLSVTESLNDRYIPSRDSTNIALRFDDILVENNVSPNEFYDPLKQSFDASLREALLDDASPSSVLSLRGGASSAKRTSLAILDHESVTRGAFQRYRHCQADSSRAGVREISTTPEHVLDAPDMLDDFYTNVLDWSSTNRVAVGLGRKLFLWANTTDPIVTLTELPGNGNNITAVKWSQAGDHVAIGCNDNTVQIWDVTTQQCVRAMDGHLARVTALDWNGPILTSGARDALILHHDVRSSDPYTSVLRAHTQEICGLKWSPDGTQLASGANDNTCYIWEQKADTPRFALTEHKAAVKALAWCPWQSNLLATGGGTADRYIRFWNTSTGTCMNAIDTDSQVCSLIWSTHTKEILSAHGFSQNQLTVWKYPTMQRVTSLTGHTKRILHTAVSPNGTTVCSAAADETLRFWNVWEPAKKRTSPHVDMMAMESSMFVR